MKNGTNVREMEGREHDAIEQEKVKLDTESVQVQVGCPATEMALSRTDEVDSLEEFDSGDEKEGEEKEGEEKEKEKGYESGEQQKRKNEKRELEQRKEDEDPYRAVNSGYYSQTYRRQSAKEVTPNSLDSLCIGNLGQFEEGTSEYEFFMSRLYDPTFVNDPDFQLLRLDLFQPIRVPQTSSWRKEDVKEWSRQTLASQWSSEPVLPLCTCVCICVLCFSYAA